MAGSHSDVWAQRVGEVFDVRPRVAIDDLTGWIERREEKKFRDAVVSPGMHVCLYGPSGSGKTSLAKSTIGRLHRRGFKFIYSKLNHNSTWSKFKSQIVENKNAIDPTRPFSYKIGIKNLIPYLEIETHSDSDFAGAADARSGIIDLIDIRHIANYLNDYEIGLAIDDLNFADDELLENLTSLAKEITDNSSSDRTKIIFIGADDVFLRIMELADSLRDRTEEIALGSIRGDDGNASTIRDDKVWNYIADGLVQLKLTDPRKDKYFPKDQIISAKRWIEYAADGLPKSIVMLGRRIAEKGERRNRVSYSDMMDSAKEMVNRNFRLYRSRYRTLFYLIKKNPIADQVCAWMFKNGASRIHTLEEISEDLNEVATYSMFDEAIKFLSDAKFLVVSGAENNVFFARDPLLAHTIGVALENPSIIGVAQNYFSKDGNAQQMLLRFVGNKDPESRDSLL